MDLWPLSSLSQRTVVGVMANLITTAILLWLGKVWDRWSVPETIYRGVVTFGIGVFLTSQLAGLLPKPEAKTLVRQWLEGGYIYSVHVDSDPPNGEVFHFNVTDSAGTVLTVFQPHGSIKVIIGTDFTFGSGPLEGLSQRDQEEIVLNLHAAFTNLGISWSTPMPTLSDKIHVEDICIFDGTMTEREFIERIFRITRAVTLGKNVLQQKRFQLGLPTNTLLRTSP